MALVQGWMPPTKENYDIILKVWVYAFPVIGNAQWLINWYGMGKTSVVSRFNVPGRVGWLCMESPGFITLLYIMRTLPGLYGIDDLPWQNRVLAGLFVIHYAYRAVAFPFLQPSMSPLHVLVCALAASFQVLNATCLGSWLAAYGPLTQAEWSTVSPIPRFVLGMFIFYIGLSANFFHDEELREIRRKEQRRQEKILREESTKDDKDKTEEEKKDVTVEKHYSIPQAGLFRYMLFPHYFSEWIEWTGFYIATGMGCVPARTFLLNEIFTMFPRAVKGKKWYVEKFGEDKVGKKWAVIPGVW